MTEKTKDVAFKVSLWSLLSLSVAVLCFSLGSSFLDERTRVRRIHVEIFGESRRALPGSDDLMWEGKDLYCLEQNCRDWQAMPLAATNAVCRDLVGVQRIWDTYKEGTISNDTYYLVTADFINRQGGWERTNVLVGCGAFTNSGRIHYWARISAWRREELFTNTPGQIESLAGSK